MAMHAIDPEGDIILTLRNPTAPFAVWYEDCDEKVDPPHQGQSSARSYETPASDSDAEAADEAADARSDDASHSPKASPKQEQVLPTSYEFTWSMPVKFRLSSKHLALASKYFKSLLQGPWKEGTEIHSDGCRHVEAQDWDENAMVILMQVIHGLNRKVPRSVTLEMLAKIAVLVDYYKCHEAVMLWSDIWIDELKKIPLPTEVNRELILWILVAYVFGKEDLFKNATKVALPLCRGYLPTLDLPIVAVADKFEERRQELVHREFTHMYGLLGLLRDRKAGCSFPCSAMLLGALTMRLHEQGILDSRPEYPYTGYSITSIISMVRKFKSPYWFDVGLFDGLHPCNLSGLFDQKMNGAVDGLELRDI
ncbi:hypothetical protein F5Y05DRAFT_403713 [Hypoxylon sp. FL0543]|nr:hypothetical protein F5Y05DRAFT_403713 [Hypoxylon sp. FL0543]